LGTFQKAEINNFNAEQDLLEKALNDPTGLKGVIISVNNQRDISDRKWGNQLDQYGIARNGHIIAKYNPKAQADTPSQPNSRQTPIDVYEGMKAQKALSEGLFQEQAKQVSSARPTLLLSGSRARSRQLYPKFAQVDNSAIFSKGAHNSFRNRVQNLDSQQKAAIAS